MKDEKPLIETKTVTSALRILGALAGAVLGAAVILFFAGFTAQRSQYDVAGLPFVFVDYWAYVEIGVTGVIRSCMLLLQSWALLLLLFVSSIAIVFALEWTRFRNFISKPHWLFVATLLQLTLLGLLVRQQLAVSHLRSPEKLTSAYFPTKGRVAEADVIPVRWPFAGRIPDAIPMPEELYSDFHRHSAEELWERIASELEFMHSQRQYLEVRPAVACKAKLPVDATSGLSIFSGSSSRGMENRATDQERAQRLYRCILVWGMFCVWFFAMLVVWEKQIRLRYLNEHAGEFATGFLLRLREEVWWVVHHLALPLNGVLLMFSFGVLMPENYGVLALPHVGQEMVEVVIEKASATGKEHQLQEPRKSTNNEGSGMRSATQNATAKLLSREKLQELSALADAYALADVEDQQTLLEKWRKEIDQVAQINTARAFEFLTAVSEMTRHYAPALANMAAEATTKLRGEVASTLRGYILYYPRSTQEQYLRLLSRDDRVAGTWNLVPIKLDDIKELRVVSDEQTRRVISRLRLMRKLSPEDPEERNKLLIEMELEGHWALLEISLAATKDPSAEVRGPALTSVARYASTLDATEWGRLRRQRAVRVLLAHSNDLRTLPDHRGAVATSLYRIVTPEQRNLVGSNLLHSISNDQFLRADPAWVAGGNSITALGKLKYHEAVPRLLELLNDTNVVMHVRGSIPTALLYMDETKRTIPALTNLLASTDAPVEVLGTTLTALGRLGRGSEFTVSAALHAFCEASLNDPRFTAKPELLNDYLGAAVSAIIASEDPEGMRHLQAIVKERQRFTSRTLNSPVRIATLGLGRIQSVSSEPDLIDLAKDTNSPVESRAAALHSLAKYRSDSTLSDLWDIWKEDPHRLLKAVAFDTVRKRADAGSGRAKHLLKRMEESDAGDSLRPLIERVGQ